MIKKYRIEKEVKAVQYKGGNPSKDILNLCDTSKVTEYKACIDIVTSNAVLKAYKNDWIIKDKDGELFVIPSNDFEYYKEIK